MSYLSWEHLQVGLFHRKAWVRGLAILAVCLVIGIPVGAMIGLLGALYGSAVLIVLTVAYLMLRIPLFGLVVLAGIICLLPFAALPIDIGFAPTFLDLALMGVFFVWISRLAAHKEDGFLATSPSLAVVFFMAMSVVSFIAGLSHGPLTTNVIRHFGEILLSVTLFFLVINLVRTTNQLKVVVLALIFAGFAAAMLGVVLYILPDELTVRLLSLLRVVRYPTGPDVLRYIEDNPELPLRATSTSIDPNVLGGMLIFGITLTATQVVAQKPVLPRRWLAVMLATMVLCMILTFSRGALVGLAGALLLLGLLRYPRMLWIGLLVVALLAFLPPAQFYIQHFIEGIRIEDLATQMRIGEYKDALTLISRYPWFGVGFSGTPDIDTYLGVSNVYLLIAEEMGVLGLAVFLGAVLTFLVRFFRARRQCPRDSELEPLLLGTCLSVAGAMTGGIFDHYLFNLDFPHAAALFWLMVGLGTSSIRLVRSKPPRQEAFRESIEKRLLSF